MLPSHLSKANGYRRKAKSCEGLVAHALSTEDRDRLLRVRDSYLARAANEERLDGLPPTTPACAAAVMQTRH
jgi:hypothetical protein